MGVHAERHTPESDVPGVPGREAVPGVRRVPGVSGVPGVLGVPGNAVRCSRSYRTGGT